MRGCLNPVQSCPLLLGIVNNIVGILQRKTLRKNVLLTGKVQVLHSHADCGGKVWSYMYVFIHV